MPGTRSGSGLRFLAGSRLEFNEYGTETLPSVKSGSMKKRPKTVITSKKIMFFD